MKIGELVNPDVDHLAPALLRQTMMSGYATVVPACAPALDVAGIADATGTLLIVVTGDHGTIAGVTAARWIIGQFAQRGYRTYETLCDTLFDLACNPDETTRRFQLDFLVHRRIELHECRRGHYTPFPDCPVHA